LVFLCCCTICPTGLTLQWCEFGDISLIDTDGCNLIGEYNKFICFYGHCTGSKQLGPLPSNSASIPDPSWGNMVRSFVWVIYTICPLRVVNKNCFFAIRKTQVWPRVDIRIRLICSAHWRVYWRGMAITMI
jgi:hypothetical protein